MSAWRTGDAFWIGAFPPLDGGEWKRRTAIYIDLSDVHPPDQDGKVVFIGTTRDRHDELNPELDHDAVYVAYGLPQECWALPRWAEELHPSVVIESAGRLPLVLVEKLVDAVVNRSYEDCAG